MLRHYLAMPANGKDGTMSDQFWGCIGDVGLSLNKDALIVVLNLRILLRVALTLGRLFQWNIRISPATVSQIYKGTPSVALALCYENL